MFGTGTGADRLPSRTVRHVRALAREGSRVEHAEVIALRVDSAGGDFSGALGTTEAYRGAMSIDIVPATEVSCVSTTLEYEADPTFENEATGLSSPSLPRLGF